MCVWEGEYVAKQETGTLRTLPQHPKILEASLRSGCLLEKRGEQRVDKDERTSHMSLVQEKGTHRPRHPLPLSLPLSLSFSSLSLSLYLSLLSLVGDGGWGAHLESGAPKQTLAHTCYLGEGILASSTSPREGKSLVSGVIFPITDMSI